MAYPDMSTSPVFDLYEIAKGMLSECDTFQALVDADDATEALDSIYEEGVDLRETDRPLGFVLVRKSTGEAGGLFFDVANEILFAIDIVTPPAYAKDTPAAHKYIHALLMQIGVELVSVSDRLKFGTVTIENWFRAEPNERKKNDFLYGEFSITTR